MAAGLAAVTAPVVGCFAADLPFLSAVAVDELRAELAARPAAAVALYVDGTGRDQVLAAVWRTAVLRDAVAALAAARGGGLAGASVRQLIAAAGLAARRTVSDSSGPPPWFDCDTEADLAEARRWTAAPADWSGRSADRPGRSADWPGRSADRPGRPSGRPGEDR